MYEAFGTLRAMPLMVLPLAIFAAAAVAQTAGDWASAPALTFDMFSGVQWTATYGDAFTFGSLIVLFVEIVKSVHTDARSILNHGFSTLVTLVSIVLFVTTPSFTNSTFFLLIVIMLIDVIAGFVITIVSARRDFGVQG